MDEFVLIVSPSPSSGSRSHSGSGRVLQDGKGDLRGGRRENEDDKAAGEWSDDASDGGVMIAMLVMVIVK